VVDGLQPGKGLTRKYAHYARGEAGQVYTSVQDLTGHPARDITEFAAVHAGLLATRGNA